jgi:hypothetical protein
MMSEVLYPSPSIKVKGAGGRANKLKKVELKGKDFPNLAREIARNVFVFS